MSILELFNRSNSLTLKKNMLAYLGITRGFIMSSNWSILRYDDEFQKDVIARFIKLVNDAHFLEKYSILYFYSKYTVYTKPNKEKLFCCAKGKCTSESDTKYHTLEIPNITEERGFEFFNGELFSLYCKVVELYKKQEEERKRLKQASDALEKVNAKKNALAQIDSLIAR
jgi:hypothetical protein